MEDLQLYKLNEYSIYTDHRRNSTYKIVNRKNPKKVVRDIRSFRTAKFIILLSVQKRLPSKLTHFLLLSLLELTTDPDFKKEIIRNLK